MIERIKTFIKAHPSYTKKGKQFLAKKFNCSERTIAKVMKDLQDVSRSYRSC